MPAMATKLFMCFFALVYGAQCKSWPAKDTGAGQWRIAIIADLDEASKVDDKTWRSYMLNGTLNIDGFNRVTVVWDSEMTELTTQYSEELRGAELSELIRFDGRLLTVGDKTGIVYEILDGKLVPWVILANGGGKESTGFKGEWMTVKDGELYVGSHGYAIFTPDGVVNRNRQYVKKISREGVVQSVDWSNEYNKMMAHMGITPPNGYITHEAVIYSSLYYSWLFFPRKISYTQFDNDIDEQSGTNQLIWTNNFNNFGSKPLGVLEPTRGCSAARFIPSTNDNAFVTLKAKEVGNDIATYISAYDVHGNVLMEDTLIFIGLKFDGLSFL